MCCVTRTTSESFAAVLLGTAVGDALGLPAEGVSRQRIHRLWRGVWRHRFLAGRGMISDDTEHTLMVTQALLAHPDDAAAFHRALGWKLRWWSASLPAGVGLATAKACLRLWIGFPPDRCAVASAGSGPAMRCAIIGAFFAHAPERRRAFVLASTRLTHRSWQAETAALAVAEVVALAVTAGTMPAAANVFSILRGLIAEREWQDRLGQMESSLARGDSVGAFAESLGLGKGVSGYALHVVPVALYAWLRHGGEYRTAMVAALDCGGDTDTVGAILGALCGAAHGAEAIPAEWIDGIVDWPRSVGFMRGVAERLARQSQSVTPLGEVRYFWPGLVLRNVVFLVVVLLHGFRRLLPPNR